MRKVVKIYVILIISIIALYYIVIFTFILWPNKLKSSPSVIQNELSVTHPNGTGQIEVLEKLNTFGPVVFRTKDEGVISAKIGSYATPNFLFGIFALSEVVVVDFTFDDKKKLTGLKVWKYLDGP